MPRFSRATWLLVLPFLLMLSACTLDDGQPQINNQDPRGKIVSAELQNEWTKDQVDSIISSTLDPTALQLLTPENGVRIYKLIYETIDAHGQPTVASGALVLPFQAAGSTFPMASYQHGTVLRKANVASAGNNELVIGIVMAADGYITAMPDYLGLGDGPGFHPYVHAKSEASAVIDMLRASRNFVESQEMEWDNRIFLFGYSQGGHATMAAHREIQQFHGDEFVVTASAPMAGPYDASGVQEQVIVGYDPYPTPGYLPYIIYSYELVYDLPGEPWEILKPPYDSIVQAMMGGQYSIGSLNNLCHPVPREMVKDSVMAAYEADANHPLKVALRDNDLWDWVPETPVMMFYCEADDQVSYLNSIVAYNIFRQNGSDDVYLYHTNPNLNHGDCAFPSLITGKFLFDSLKALP